MQRAWLHHFFLSASSTSWPTYMLLLARPDTFNMDAAINISLGENENRRGSIIGMMIGALTLSCVIVGLRMYTRAMILKSVRSDDWTIVLALVLDPLLTTSSTLADID